MDRHWTAAERPPREAFDVAQGSWWRFDRYEIRDTRVCPAPGACLLQYDPWEQYSASRTGDNSIDPPYTALLTLVGALEDDPETVIQGQEVHLGNNGQQSLTQWCAEYGLLGLLSHQTVVASLAPRWEDVISATRVVPIRRVHRWDPYGWSPTFDAWLLPNSHPPDEVRAGDLVSPALYDGYWPEPLALVRMIRDGRWATQQLAEAWGPYFPDVPPAERNTYVYPVPESDEFWAEYCEPTGWLLGAASQLRGAILDLNLDDVAQPPEVFLGRIDRGIRDLHNLLAPVQPSITLDSSGEYRQTWRTRSLLASFALMALLDMTEQRRVLTCGACGRIFVSAAHAARYCSTRCRGTAQKRAYRARIRDRIGR